MSIPFRQAPFTITGGTTARSLDQRFGDVINVKEFESLKVGGSGTLGDNTGDDAPAIQAAFNLAFGSSSTPHGLDNAHLNREVFFPPGKYNCETALNLTRVVGGHIYGSGNHCTLIVHSPADPPGGSTITPTLNINGAVGLCIERLAMEIDAGGGVYTGTNTCALNLDWDGVAGATGGGGLRFNNFVNCSFGGGETVVIIADYGEEGYNNMFTNVFIGGGSPLGGIRGMEIRGPDALNNSIVGGGVAYCPRGGIRCPPGGGSIHAQGIAPTGNYYPLEPLADPDAADFIIESGHVCHLAQWRSESHRVLRLEDGIVHFQAFVTQGVDDFIVVNGGKLILESCQLQNSALTAQIHGTGGEVHVSGIFNGPGPSGSTMFDEYTGTVVFDPENWQDL